MKITIDELKKIIEEELTKARKDLEEKNIEELDTSKKATLARIKQNRDKVKAAKEKEKKERDFEDAAAAERWKYKQSLKDEERYNKQKDFLKKKFGSRAAKAVLDRHAAGYAPLRHWAKKSGDGEDVLSKMSPEERRDWKLKALEKQLKKAQAKRSQQEPQEKEWEKVQKKWLKGRDKDEYEVWRINNPMKEERMKITIDELKRIIGEELTKAEKEKKKELEKELDTLKHK